MPARALGEEDAHIDLLTNATLALLTTPAGAPIEAAAEAAGAVAAQPASNGLFSTDNLWKMLAVLIYAVVLVVIGVAASKRMHNIRDYFASNKSLGFLAAAFSSRATGESAWLLLGLTGMGYAFGAHAFWVVLGEIIGVGGAWLFMTRRFKRLTDRYDSITVPDYLESRLRDSSHWLRLIAAGSLLIFVPIYAGAQVHAAGGAFFNFLGWDHYLGASIGFLIVLFYITQGGFTAVVWSDIFQGTLMLVGLVVLPIVGLLEAGNVTNIIDSLRGINPDLLTLHGPGPANADGVREAGTGGWSPLTITSVIGLAAIGLGFFGSPQVFVRFISLRSEKEINKGTLVAISWTVLATSGAVLIGMIGRALFEPEIGTNQEGVVPYMADTLLHAFFSGVFIAMVLSAIMSTIDSLLVVAASAGVRDYWQKTKHPEMGDDTLVKLSKLVTLGLAFVAFGIGVGILLYDKEQGIFWTIIFGWSGIAATFCPTMILSLFWTRLTAMGAKCAMVAGFMAVPFLKFGFPPLAGAVGLGDVIPYLNAIDVLAPAFVVGFAVAIVVSLLDKNGQDRMIGVADELRAPAPEA